MDSAYNGATVVNSLSVLALDMFVTGSAGWISACTANVNAAQSVALFDLGTREGDPNAARSVFRAIHPFVTYAATSEQAIHGITGSADWRPARTVEAVACCCM